MTMQDTGSRRAALSDAKRALLEARLRGAPPAAAAPREGIPRCAGDGPEFPASFGQERMFFLSQLAPEGPLYHVPLAWLVRADTDVDVLRRALAEIVRRHEVLRTVYSTGEGELRQVVRDPAPVPVEVHDLRARVGADWLADARALAAEEIARPLPPLTEGPVLRAALLRVTDERSVLVLTFHHVAVDGWSSAIVAGELLALYEAFAEGRPSPLPEPALRYADYAVWQRDRLRGEALERLSAFWREHLKDAPVLELPTDRPRPPVPSHAAGTHRFSLDARAAAGLRAVCAAEQATLNMGMIAVLCALLSRWTGQERVVLGTAVAGRSRVELEPVVGLFVNTLALSVDVSGDPSFAGLLRRARATVLAADRHQEMPFERVVELLDLPRDPSRTPVFQVFYSHPPRGGDGEGPGGRMDPLPLSPGEGVEAMEAGAAQFDLGVTAQERGDRIGVMLEYAADLFDAETIQRLERHLATLLDAAAADPQAPLSRLPLLSADERARLVVQAAGPALPEPDLVAAHRRFEAQAARTPHVLAVEGEDGALTYAELNARANRLAHHLVAMGVGPDARVGVCVEPGVGMMAAVLGVLKAGGAYVPVDPAYPADRLAYLLADSGARPLVTHSALLDRLPLDGIDVVVLDQDADAIAAWPETTPAIPCSLFPVPSSLAYVIYTSGSTGRPKGVRVEHGALAATLAAAGRAFGLGPADRAPSLASFAFDIWLVESLLPLLTGGSVRFFTRERVLEVPRLVEELASFTMLHAVPALMRGIVQAVRAMPGGVLPGLRRACVGGDAVPPDLLEEMRAAFPAAEISVLYGPTEAAVICAAHRLDDEPASRRMVGRPLGNATLHVLEPGGTVAPTGVPGELCLGGPSVARDYHGRPGLTAERFVPDPFAAGPGARLYRTGDRVRRLPSGELEFLGRTDHQVKVRGFRIEPGEVEAALRAHPDVRDCVVAVREDVPGDRRLVGYLVVSGEGAPNAGELRAFLRQRLPEYMVPSAFVPVEGIPLTPNGKVDFRALPAPGRAGEPGEEYVAPRNAVEDLVAEVWAEVLRRDRVGVTQSFFELGGHSLLATQVVVRIRETFEVEIPIRVFFQDPTIAGLARAVEDAGSPVLAAMVDELAGLSAEEIEALLAEEGV